VHLSCRTFSFYTLVQIELSSRIKGSVTCCMMLATRYCNHKKVHNKC